ncbi:MAG: hypothetical protein AABZ80_03650 [Gemmatimonadota bacterium]
MDKKLKFEFEWEEPGGARGAELRATWARFRIDIDGQSLTQLLDHRTNSVRTSVYLPLYPVAEWIATHWWFLAREFETPEKASNGYAKRHDLRFAGEGFALPSVQFKPLGDYVRIEWKRRVLESQRVEFPARGEAYIPLDAFQQALRDLVSAVVERLSEAKITNSLLHEEWAGLAKLDKEEQDFVSAAAALGLDPFATQTKEQDRLLRAAADVPGSLLTSFLAIASINTLEQQVATLRAAIAETAKRSTKLYALAHLRSHVESGSNNGAPWRQGYDYAQRLRKALGIEVQPLTTFASYCAALRVHENDLREAAHDEPSPLFVALVNSNAKGSPGFALGGGLAREIGRSRRATFALTRALFEYLSSPVEQPSLVTRAVSDREKRNRAFAAEFLAPAEALRAKVSGSVVGEDEMEDMAATFGVSSFVIRHQLFNHGIARSIAAMDDEE